MYAYKDVLELAGLTTRLYTLLSTLHHLPPLPTSRPDATATEPTITLSHVDVTIPTPTPSPFASDQNDLDLGTMPEIPPLVKDLNLSLGPGDHLMITGSNGVGKTAVARVLAGLWAPGGKGEVRRPGRGEVFVVPQRAYLVAGSLLDQ